MASHKSAMKKHRRDERRRLRNRAHRSRLKTQVKRLRRALDAGDADSARQMLPATVALADQIAKLGVVHPNAAARIKSRLARALNRLTAPA